METAPCMFDTIPNEILDLIYSFIDSPVRGIALGNTKRLIFDINTITKKNAARFKKTCRRFNRIATKNLENQKRMLPEGRPVPLRSLPGQRFQNEETTDAINVFENKRENIEEEEEEDFICFICMENTPSTRVEPCGHVVICKLCSDHLKQNLHFDFRTECIKCRNPIEFVVDIETDETEICIN